MDFSDLGLGDDVLRAVTDAGYTTPTPIQAQAIPYVLMSRDILGCAQTGTGKTASFTLPMIDILGHGQAKSRMPRSLILEPTRELAAQVAENFEVYGKYHKLSKALLIGGTSMEEQIKVMDRGVDVLIATPGRLLDLFDRGRILMNDVKILVIDEADRMLDMGFIPDVERIVSLVSKIRQTLFFSATMPPEIRRLADAFLMNPKEITVSLPSSVAETVVQGLLVVKHGDGRRPGGGQKEKREALRTLVKREKVKNALVFCNRKRDVSVVCRSLLKHGFNAGQLHGDMAQSARMEILEKFKQDEITLLVCSDVAARGLDIQNMSHVFNFDVPTHAEDYVHRIGRTGRAGRQGHAYTIALPEDGKYLDSICRLIGKEIPRIDLNGSDSPDLVITESKDRGRRRERSKGGRQDNDNKRNAKPAQNAKDDDNKRNAQPAQNAKDNDNKRNAKPAQNAKDDRKRGNRSRKRDSVVVEDTIGNEPVIGMGSSVPAFMRQPIAPVKKRKR